MENGPPYTLASGALRKVEKRSSLKLGRVIWPSTSWAYPTRQGNPAR